MRARVARWGNDLAIRLPKAAVGPGNTLIVIEHTCK